MRPSWPRLRHGRGIKRRLECLWGVALGALVVSSSASPGRVEIGWETREGGCLVHPDKARSQSRGGPDNSGTSSQVGVAPGSAIAGRKPSGSPRAAFVFTRQDGTMPDSTTLIAILIVAVSLAFVVAVSE
jgi:hypothetical protein